MKLKKWIHIADDWNNEEQQEMYDYLKKNLNNVEATKTIRNETNYDVSENITIPAGTEVEIFLKVKLIK